jgi:superfamily II DNA or RNA helicase
MITLRPYQIDTIHKARKSIISGNKSIIIQANCGAGKTIMAASIIESALAKGNKVVFLVHLRQLAYQALERFTEFGMGDKVGIIMSGEMTHLSRPVQIISVQTYARRLEIEDPICVRWFREADIVIYDECHSSLAPTRKVILDMYKETSIIIGLSATPCRSDQRPLGKIYQDIVTCSSIKELTEQGFLVPIRYFGADQQPDLENIPIVAGDYNQKVLGTRVNKVKLVGGIIDNWLRIAENRSTVIFATNVKHSLHIKEQFLKVGISIEHIDAKTPPDEREEILNRFKSGETKIVTNVGVFSEGADFPWASCVVLARPTKSLARYIQMAGRGARPFPGKENLILICHSGAIEMHGFLDEKIEWTLEGKEKAFKKADREGKEKCLSQCRICKEIFSGTSVCPRCGTELQSFGKPIEAVDAELVELKARKKTNRDLTNTDKRRLMGMLTWMQYKRGWKPGRTAHIYREITSVWPNKYKDAEPIEPCGELQNLIKYAIIKSAKRYQKEIAK